MKQFTPDKYLGHKLGRIHRNIDRYFDRHKDGAGPCLPRTQGMIIGFLMDNVERDIFQKDIEAHFDLKGATVTNMLKSLEKNGFIIRTPMENDARLKRITLTEKAYEREEIHPAAIGLEAVLRQPLVISVEKTPTSFRW